MWVVEGSRKNSKKNGSRSPDGYAGSSFSCVGLLEIAEHRSSVLCLCGRLFSLKKTDFD